MTRDETEKLVAMAVAGSAQASRMTPGQVDAMIDMWSMTLGDLGYDHACAALVVVAQTSPYLPAVADVRAAALELERGATRTGAEAWGDVQRAMANEGARKSPGVDFAFRDPTVHLVVQSLGWRELCLSENDISDRARFIEAYDQVQRREKRENVAPMLGEAKRLRELAGGVARALDAKARLALPPVLAADPDPWENG